MRAKSVFSTTIAIAGLVLAPLIFAAEQETTEVATIAVTNVEDFVKNDKDAVILDVRTPAEFQMSHIPDAVNINVQDDSFEAMVAKLDRDKPYIVHCTKNPVDGRSAAALVKLQELGFTKLISMEGGWVAWTEADLPLIKDTE